MYAYELLEQALDLIPDEDHWLQHRPSNGDGAYCAIGAVNVVTVGYARHTEEAAIDVFKGFDAETKNAYKQAVDALDKLAEAEGYVEGLLAPAIVAFNNDRTHAEVVELFQQAIRKLKAQAGEALEDTQAPSATQAALV